MSDPKLSQAGKECEKTSGQNSDTSEGSINRYSSTSIRRRRRGRSVGSANGCSDACFRCRVRSHRGGSISGRCQDWSRCRSISRDRNHRLRGRNSSWQRRGNDRAAGSDHITSRRPVCHRRRVGGTAGQIGNVSDRLSGACDRRLVSREVRRWL